MSKLTPKQAFEHLKAMFPWLHEIVKDSSSTVLIDKCGQKVEPLSANKTIDQHFKPSSLTSH